MINYPQPIAWEQDFNRWLQLRAEHGAAGLNEKVAEVRTLLRECLEEIMALPGDKELCSREPEDPGVHPASETRGSARDVLGPS